MYCDTILHDKKYLILDCNNFHSIVVSVVCVLFVLLHLWYHSLDRTVCIVTRLWARCLRNHDSIPDGGKRFFFSRAHRLALGPTQPGTRQIIIALSPGVRWLGHETCHLPQCRAERCGEQYIHSFLCLHGLHRDSFPFFTLECVVKCLSWSFPHHS